jgi:nicotinamide riboside transporter PnuC
LTATLSTLLFPIPLFLVADHAPTFLIALVAFIAGAFVTVFSVQWSTTLQREIPSDVLSRVSAYDWLGSLAFTPIWMALVGPVAVDIGTATTLVVSAVVMMILIVAVLFVPSVIQLRLPETSA